MLFKAIDCSILGLVHGLELSVFVLELSNLKSLLNGGCLQTGDLSLKLLSVFVELVATSLICTIPNPKSCPTKKDDDSTSAQE